MVLLRHVCSSQVLLDGVPFVPIRTQDRFGDGTVKRVPALGANPTMLCQVCLVSLDQQVAQALPREDVEKVIPVLLNSNEGHNEAAHRANLRISDNLPRVVKRDVAILFDVAKLPRTAATCFDLDRDVSPAFVGCNDIVMRDISGERCSNQATPGKLSRNKILARLSN